MSVTHNLFGLVSVGALGRVGLSRLTFAVMTSPSSHCGAIFLTALGCFALPAPGKNQSLIQSQHGPELMTFLHHGLLAFKYKF